jgi:hypothetical protein
MRHKSQNPFSLFSFQDIITGLCGIMIFLVLIMLVDIITRRAAESVPVMEVSEVQRLEAEVASLEEKARTLLAAIRAKRAAAASDAPEETRHGAAAELADAEASARRTEAEGRNAAKAASDAAAANESAAEKVRMLEARATELEKRLEELKKQNRITLIPEEGFRKKPVYLVLSATDTELASPYLDGGRRTSCGTGDEGFRTALAKLEKLGTSDYCVVLLVRPDSFDRMERIAFRLREAGFDVGRDPIGQNAELDFGEEGGK